MVDWAKTEELLREAQKGGLEFIKTELQTGLTFAQSALQSDDQPEKRTRNQANARKAYESALAWSQRFPYSEPIQRGLHELEPLFEELKHALEQLGEL